MTFSPANRTTAPLKHANCGANASGPRIAGRNRKGEDLFDQADYLRPLVERADPVSDRLVMGRCSISPRNGRGNPGRFSAETLVAS
jgi:hypothetical protein